MIIQCRYCGSSTAEHSRSCPFHTPDADAIALGGRASAMTFDWDAVAPDWANWHTTDSSGATWWENEPLFDPMYNRYMRTTGEYLAINDHPQPMGKIPRQTATAERKDEA